MSRSKVTVLGHRVETLSLVLGAGAAAWLLSVLLVHAAYRLVPAQPSEASTRLEREANQRPPLFENGFRYGGWLAPVDMDPLVFGRCVYSDVEERKQLALAGKNVPDRSHADTQARVTQCLQGKSLLEHPKPAADDWAKTSWTQEDWLKLARTSPNPVLVERAEAVWRHGPLRLSTDFTRPGGHPTPLLWLAQWRVASAVMLWRDGRRDEALQTWTTSAQRALDVTGDDLVETMNAASTLTRLLLSLHAAVRSSDTVDEISASRATRIASLVETLPEAGQRALISEWQGMAFTIRSTDASVRTKWQGKREEDPASQGAWLYLLSFFGLINDPVDSVNLLSAEFEPQRAAMLAAAHGQSPGHVTPHRSCPWLGPFWHVCRPYERNPLGRWMARQPANYIPYGTRIADLRNLAAATRLTIEAKRKGLTGEALAHFIAHAPDGMRDVFTRQPFAYDAQTRTLAIVLREKSPVLGMAGEYRLPL